MPELIILYTLRQMQGRGGLMVSLLISGSSGPGSSPGRRQCVVFLGKTLYRWQRCNGLASHPGGSQKYSQLHASCYRNQDKFWPCSYADFTYLPIYLPTCLPTLKKRGGAFNYNNNYHVAKDICQEEHPCSKNCYFCYLVQRYLLAGNTLFLGLST